MTKTHSSIATDSEEELRGLVGDDATANFESDPEFLASDPAAHGSSASVAVQRDTDDTADSEEEIEDEEPEDEDEEETDDDELDEEEEDEDEAETDVVVDKALRM
jgi:hypothetical protein